MVSFIWLIIFGIMGYVIYRMYQDCIMLFTEKEHYKTENEILKLSFRQTLEFEKKTYEILLEQYGHLMTKEDKESIEGMIILTETELETELLKVE